MRAQKEIAQKGEWSEEAGVIISSDRQTGRQSKTERNVL